MIQGIAELKKVHLAEFCINELGYRVVTNKDCPAWRYLEHEASGNRILVKSTPFASGDYLWRSINSDKQGSIIHLLIECHGYTLDRIREEFCGKDITNINSSPKSHATGLEQSLDSTSEIKKHYDRFKSKVTNGSNYLTKRGIKPEVLEYFGLSAATNEAFFPLYSFDENKRWVVSTAIRYVFDKYGERKKWFLKGFRKGGAFCLFTPYKSPLQNFNTLKIFESPIDALSYAQLFPNEREAISLSFCGGFGAPFLKQLRQFIDRKHIDIKMVTICLDNDEKGRQSAGELKKHLRGLGVSVWFPKGKDWNEDLC